MTELARQSVRETAELEVDSVTKSFGGLTALADVGFTVRRGETFGIIGPNGAGKTTLLNVISGFFPPDAGEVLHRGDRVSGKRVRAVVEHGITRTFQLTAVFPEMTVLENIQVACHLRQKPSYVHDVLGTRRARRAATKERIAATEIAETIGLGRYKQYRAGQLPYGLKKSLSVAISLATEPSVVLLDEPVVGMNDAEVDRMLGNIRALGEKGVTVVVVEHNVQFIMDICDRILVLDFGRRLAEGRPGEIRTNPAVVDAYLGTAS